MVTALAAISLALGAGFKPANSYNVGTDPLEVITGDFDRDGDQDLVVGQSSRVSILLGKGDGGFKAPLSRSLNGEDANDLVVARINGDRKLDVAAASFGADAVFILRGRGNGTLRAAKKFKAGISATGIVTFNFDHDGMLDLAVANDSGDSVSILRGRGDGTFRKRRRFELPGDHYGIARGDFNRDRKQDLATADPKAEAVSVLLGK